MNVATGAKDRNGPQRIKRRPGLTLVTNSNSPKKILRIGICENVFSPRQERIRKTDIAEKTSESKLHIGGELQEPPFSGRADTAVTFAVLGFVLGYLAGKLGR